MLTSENLESEPLRLLLVTKLSTNRFPKRMGELKRSLRLNFKFFKFLNFAVINSTCYTQCLSPKELFL